MMNKEIIETDEAPKAIGPYSQAVRAGGFVFLSGQIPIEPSTGEVVKEGIMRQTQIVLKNISAILTETGLTFEDVVKTTIYLRDISKFKDVNEVYKEFFKSAPPARATVEVSNLPLGVEIEIDAVAVYDR